jgi:hypothetical protein
MASKKVSTLNALTSAGDDDLLYIADTSDSGASYASKRITVQNFLNGTASANALATEILDRSSGDTALSNRLDVLEADPTTATDVAAAIAVETAARQAADALALPLAGGTMTGDIELGSGGGGPASATLSIKSVVDFGPNYENITVTSTTTGSPGAFFADDDPSAPGSAHVAGDWGTFPSSIDGVNIDETAFRSGAPFTPGKRWYAFGYGANNSITITLNSTESFTSYTQGAGYTYNTPVVHGGGASGGATTIGTDGTATFGGAISASTVPTDDAHLVNKLYADNLVAGVDLSGIATNTAAISAETAARTAADALLMPKSGGTFTGAISGPAPTSDLHLATKKYADDLVANVDLSQVETNRLDIAAEATARTNADTALSGRLDSLESDPTTQSLLDAETSARTAADTAETNARTSADTALSGRLDTLEADPTTQTLLDAETAARIAGDALKLDLAGGTMSGDIVMAVAASTVAQPTVTKTTTSFGPYSIYSGATGQEIHSITVVADGSYSNSNFAGIFINGSHRGGAETSGSWDTTAGISYADNAFDDNSSSYAVFAAGTYTYTFDTPVNTGSTDVLGRFRRLGVTVNLVGGAGGTTATVGIDGSAFFSGNVTASAVPSDNAHLVNKLYADNLVAGVDLSGIANNAAAIEALTNGAPELLNTLNELADAIGDDENFATTVTGQIAAETTARTNADTALSGRLDTLEADPTTATAVTSAIAVETAARQAADTTETNARTSADTALSGRLDTLEADPTTGAALTAETTARTSADSALSGRLDTLEADPTTQTLLDAETAARIAGDALLLPLAGGTMSGAIQLGSGGGVNEFEVVGVGSTPNEVFAGTGYLTEVQVFQGTSSTMTMLHGIVVDGVVIQAANHPGVVSNNFSADGSSGWYADLFVGDDAVDSDLGTNAIVYDSNQEGWIKYVPTTPIPVSTNVEIKGREDNIYRVTIDQGAGGAASTLGVDGTATFGSTVSASAVPTADAHLVNKLYADNLVAGVDLSGIATNTAAITAESVARINADNALSGRLDTLEADPTTATDLAAETTARTNADTALSGRLDTLEADATTQTLLDAEATARANADTLLDGRLDTLEADPTTATALASEATTRANADTALSGRLNTLEADPTTATAVTSAIAVETAARQAADALLLPLAGGTMSGAIELGSGGGNEVVVSSDNSVSGSTLVYSKPYDDTAYLTAIKVEKGTAAYGLARLAEIKLSMTRITGGATVTADEGGFESGYAGSNAIDSSSSTRAEAGEFILVTFDTPLEITNSYGGRVDVRAGLGNIITAYISADASGGGGGSATTIGVDGTATFGGNVPADAVPTADAHLVNKLYADNLVAGVDLSGIATNAAAIQSLTNGAPELLNTLQELASALGDDANFSTTVTGQIAANEVHIDNAATLFGVAKDSTNLGAFTGSTISDTSNIKVALQALETAIETPSTASQIQTVEQTANGTFHVTFVDSNNGSATAESLFTDGGLTYNPFTDLLSGGSVDMTKFFFNGTEVTATGAELNFLGGLTSGVQTQLDGKVTTGANISALVGDTSAGDVPVDVNGTDNYLFLVIDKANGALTAIDKTFLEAE